MSERQLPHNTEAEEAVLGSILIDSDVFPLVKGKLLADDFYHEHHQVLYEAMCALDGRGRAIDSTMVIGELERSGKLEIAGGYGKIFEYINCVPTSGNASAYAIEVREAAVYRHLVGDFAHLAALAWKQDPSTMSTALERIHSRERRLAHNLGDFKSMTLVAEQYLERLTLLHDSKSEGVGIGSGIYDLDRMTNGWQKSDFIILMARPAVGKTTFLLHLIKHAAKEGAHIAAFSLEMSSQQLFNKMLSGLVPENGQNLQVGRFDDTKWDRIIRGIEDLSALDISICDTPGLTIQELSMMAHSLHAVHAIDFLVVDYMQLLMSVRGGKRVENRQQEITDVTQGLKQIARELNIPVLALAQMSRSVESRASKVPQLSDLRESGSGEQEADIVLALYRDEVYNPETERPNQVDIIVLKHRNGPLGEVTILMDKPTSSFKNLSDFVESTLEEVQE